ncbi:MAG: HAMP domain-containing protein, partial [Pseudomonadota bacterium]
MKIGAKIALGFTSVLALTAIVGAIGWGGLSGYASGVDKARSMSELVVDLHRMPLHIAEFERGDDDAGLDKAHQLMAKTSKHVEELIDRAPTSSMAAIERELIAYRHALEHYREFHEENRSRQAIMAKTTHEIDEKARQIYALNYDRYENGLFILEDLERQSAVRFRFLESANALMRATLAAQQAEADFQIDPTPEARQQAKSFMKEIYLANLSLKKISKEAGEEGEAIKTLFKEVKNYRRNFGAFMEAVDEEADVVDVKMALESTSAKVRQIAEGIAHRQKQAFATISGQAQNARSRVDDAIAAATQSMKLRNELVELHDTETTFFWKRDVALGERILAIEETIATTLAGLAENSGEDSAFVQQTLDLLPSYRNASAAAREASLGQAAALAAMGDIEANVLTIAAENAADATATMANLYDWGRLTLGIVCGLAMILGVSISVLAGRSISGPLRVLTSSITDLAKGNSAVAIPMLDRADEIGDMARSMGVIRETGTKALRAQKTLENTEACLMMVGSDGNILHVNPAFCTLATEVRGDVGRELFGFNDTEFGGQSFDMFHNEPSLNHDKLSQLSSTTKALVTAGGHTFDLKLNPVFDADSRWIGTVVSWQDRTAQVRLEAEIEALIDAASAGNLAGRLATDQVEGFMLTLCEGMNRLMETVEGGIKSASHVMSALADGDLTREMTGTYQGIFHDLQQDSNRMRSELSSIATNIVRVSDTLNIAAKEIASGTSDLTARTQAQASSVEQTSSSMVDVTTTVRQNTESALEANQIASTTRSAADSGHQVVG